MALKTIQKKTLGKKFAKGSLKALLYLLILLISGFIFLAIASDLWLKSYEIESSEMLSAPLKDFPAQRGQR